MRTPIHAPLWLCLTLAAPCLAQGPHRACLASDTTLDAIYFVRDLGTDNDANDPGEATVFFDASNASGLPLPTGNVFSILFHSDGSVFIGNGDSDSVYRVFDLNRDGDANDPGEALLFYTGPTPLVIETPNGLAEGPNGEVYIVTAGAATATADAVIRCADTTNDWDAMDPGEAVVWCDLSTVAGSSPFSVAMLSSVAYVIDLRGSSTDVIFRAEDADNGGTVTGGELSIFYDIGAPLGAPIGFALVAEGSSIHTIDNLSGNNPQRLTRLTDIDNSKTLDAGEVADVWSEAGAPAGSVASLFDFTLTRDPAGRLVAFVASSGSDAQDNIFRAIDTTADNDLLDAGETSVFIPGMGAGNFPESIRAIRAYSTPCWADYNHDGFVDGIDSDQFNNDFEVGSPRADYNRDGFVDGIDSDHFYNDFAAGC